MSTLRSDAQRNLERVLEAAAETFAERGPDASIDEIARRAGVGHATVFRRFPTKDSLIAAVVQEHVSALEALAEAALAREDADAAFTDFIWQVAELHMKSRGLHECLLQCEAAPDKARLEQTAQEIVERAQAAGAVRTDLSSHDVQVLVQVAMVAAPADAWQPYLRVVLDGLRAR